jgi:hypothetical protein
MTIDMLLAFVVTDAGAEVVRGLGHEDQVEALLEQLRFQIDSLRYGAARLRTHLPQLAQRVDAGGALQFAQPPAAGTLV